MLRTLHQRMTRRRQGTARRLEAKAGPGERGSTLVEFAVAISVLFTLLFGLMEFNRALFSYHFVSNAAREATRYAIVRGSACTSWATACPASATDVQNFVKTIAPTGIDTSAITATTTWTPNNNPGNLVKVTVQYNFKFMLPYLPTGTFPMTSTSQMVISQ